jgi:hypothetical protein
VAIKTYHIRNGTINGKVDVTIAEMSKAWGISKNTLYSRLNRGIFNIEKLSKKVDSRGVPKQKNKSVDANTLKIQRIEERIKTRNFYDPLSRLLLKTI